MSDWDNLVEPARAALEALIRKGDAAADRIEELEAKLAKAVEALKIISGKSMDECGRYYTNRSSIRTARNTLAELKRETE